MTPDVQILWENPLMSKRLAREEPDSQVIHVYTGNYSDLSEEHFLVTKTIKD